METLVGWPVLISAPVPVSIPHIFHERTVSHPPPLTYKWLVIRLEMSVMVYKIYREENGVVRSLTFNLLSSYGRFRESRVSLCRLDDVCVGKWPITHFIYFVNLSFNFPSFPKSRYYTIIAPESPLGFDHHGMCLLPSYLTTFIKYPLQLLYIVLNIYMYGKLGR